MKIISANVNFMPEGILSSFTTGKTEDRATKIAHHILTANPDVLVVQELYHPKSRYIFSKIIENANFKSYEGPHGSRNLHHSGQVVFVKNTITVLQSKVLCFRNFGINGEGPLESNVPKGVIYLQLQDSDGAPINLFSLHLQSEPLTIGWDLVNFIKGKRTLSNVFRSFNWHNPTNIRKRQVNLLVNWINSSRINIERAMFIGDFNVSYSTPEYETLRDLLWCANPIINREFITIGAHDNTSHSRLAWRIGCKIWGGGQLDHALITKGFSRGNFKTFKLKKDGVSLSDHEAIVAIVDS